MTRFRVQFTSRHPERRRESSYAFTRKSPASKRQLNFYGRWTLLRCLPDEFAFRQVAGAYCQDHRGVVMLCAFENVAHDLFPSRRLRLHCPRLRPDRS
jgi:hypothetical protein